MHNLGYGRFSGTALMLWPTMTTANQAEGAQGIHSLPASRLKSDQFFNFSKARGSELATFSISVTLCLFNCFILNKSLLYCKLWE